MVPKVERQAACLGKRAFIAYEHAKTAIKNMRRFAKERRPVHIYHCRYCQNWHIGGH